MESHLGGMEDNSTNPWQIGQITTGAFREDEEDVVFRHGWPLQTNNHFWDADDRTNGDFSLTHLNGVGDFKNAYNKAYLYKNGNWYDKDNNPSWIIYSANNSFYYFMYHGSLAQFYRDGILWYEKKITSNGQTINKRYYVVIEDYIKQRIVWEVLGRMCHLIQDMTLPAHAHGDVHWPEGECYEDWTGQQNNYQNYNRYTAGSFIDPYTNSYGDPVRYLYYIANQLGDFWPSKPECYSEPPQWYGDIGTYNSINGQGTYPILQSWYQALGTPPNSVNPSTQANSNLNKAISLTASLLYWFAIEAQLQQINPVPTNFHLAVLPPDRIVYKGTQGQIIPYANGINYWFEFQYRRCNWPPPNGEWYGVNNPLHGVYYADSPGRFVVVNQNYSGQSCSEGDLPVPQYPIYAKVRACSNGGCTGFLGEYLIMSSQYSPHGCPYVFNINDDSVFAGENNILHKSKFPENLNQDITDKYLIKNTPAVIDDKYVIVLSEADNDIDQYDQIKLLAIDHPQNTKIGVTEDNDIIMYDSTQVISSNFALRNSIEDITQAIQYDPDVRANEELVGDTLDHLDIQFSESNWGTYAIITEMEGDRIYPYPVAKDWAGNISITSQDAVLFTKSISRREYLSENIIPLNLQGGDISMELKFDMLKNYHANYIAVVPYSTSGFTVTELPIYKSEVIDEVGRYESDILKLTDNDANYLTLDNTSQLFLHFNTSASGSNKQGPTLKRSFILEVNGKYYSDTSLALNSKTEKKENVIPERIKLYSNYPNPFNPKTIIKFEISKPEDVELKIYNSLGQLVNTLINSRLTAGTHNVEFDGSNLPSGVYFYTLRTNNFTESRKMVLIK
ncbi:MAG: T9SS type A sorting domain-containing protein [Ignavibacteria bacterium]|nr:T9SS type A sorting domain-containing protein [Ignavibacteria bacterium]